ncbi:MAG: hypothetical protein ABI600_07510 [Luteolibacter sp.]
MSYSDTPARDRMTLLVRKWAHDPYMIYSEAFRSLPAAVKTRVLAGLRNVIPTQP